MPSDPKRLLLELIQPRSGRQSWHGGPTPLGALRGVTAEQARWTPAPRRKSLWELALHIAYWKYAVRRRLTGEQHGPKSERFPRTPANWARLPEPPDERAWKADVALLAAEHERLLEAVREVPVTKYDARPPGARKWTYGELITGIAMHDAYHTGQLQLMKRLWQERASLGRRG